MNIGFLQFGGRGDMLMATAVLAEVRRLHPNDTITWVCLDCYREVIDGHPLIDSYIAWPMLPGIERRQQELNRWAEMKAYAAVMFDKVYTPQHYPDHYYTNTRPGLHLIDQMFLNAGLEPVHPRRLSIASVGKCCRYDITFNSAGVSQGTIWTDQQWQDFTGLCKTRGWKTIDGNSAGLTWKKWAKHIAGSRAYVGLDSGGSWLAAATPVRQIVMRSSRNDNPQWLTGFAAADVKDPDKCRELIDPTPEGVVHALDEMLA